MRMSTPSIPCSLGRMAPQSPANAEELRAMRAAAWHKQGIVVVPLEDIYDEWDRVFLSGIATNSRFGAMVTYDNCVRSSSLKEAMGGCKIEPVLVGAASM